MIDLDAGQGPLPLDIAGQCLQAFQLVIRINPNRPEEKVSIAYRLIQFFRKYLIDY